MNVKTIDYRETSAGEQFEKSLHGTGFAILKNHPIPSNLLNTIYAGWKKFFASDEKLEFAFDSETQAGYYPVEISETAVGHIRKDIKEFFHVFPGSRIPAHLKQDILEYRALTMNLGRTLLGWLQAHAPADSFSGFDEALPDILSDTASLLRVLNYPPFDGSEESDGLRAAPHEDINFLTILPAAREPGLQVLGANRKWVDLGSAVDELIINTGDMLQEATAGYFPSTTHRVINPVDANSNVARISVPFFLTPGLDIVLSSRYTAGSYLDERLQAISGSTQK